MSLGALILLAVPMQIAESAEFGVQAASAAAPLSFPQAVAYAPAEVSPPLVPPLAEAPSPVPMQSPIPGLSNATYGRGVVTGPVYAPAHEPYAGEAVGAYPYDPYCGACWTCGPLGVLHSTCDMPLHFAYYPAHHGYYYFRPYNYTHVLADQAIAPTLGGDWRMPYATLQFRDMYAAMQIGRPVAEDLSMTIKPVSPMSPRLPKLEELLDEGPAPAPAP